MSPDKVEKYHGDFIKYTAGPTRNAMKLYDCAMSRSEKITGKKAKYFLRGSTRKETAEPTTLLRGAEGRYWPRGTVFHINNLRKDFATGSEDRSVSRRLVAAAQRHRPETMMANYVAKTDEDKAADTKLAWHNWFGESFAWPTDEEWEAEHRSYEVVRALFSPKKTDGDGKGDDDENDEDDADEGDDGDDADARDDDDKAKSDDDKEDGEGEAETDVEMKSAHSETDRRIAIN